MADPLNPSTPADSAFAKVAAEELRALKSSINSRLSTINGNISSLDSELDTKLNLAGGVLTGALLLHADPAAALQPATKSYVDTAVADISGLEALSTFRNKIINGNFDIWQRGSSQTSSGYGSDDRWANLNVGTTKTASMQDFTLGQTDVPGNPKYFSRTVVSSVAGAGNFCVKQQKIEGVRTLAGQTVTLSFYAKADAAKNMAVEFTQNFGTGGTPSATVAGIGVTIIPLTTAWQKFTVTVEIPSIAGKTLGTADNDCLQLNFWLDAGSTYNARTDSLGQQSGTFDIAQVQLEEGSVATPFEDRPIGLELSLCQRYYEAIPINLSTLAGTAGLFRYRFMTTKRVIPTLTVIYGSLNGADLDALTTVGFRQGTLAASASIAGIAIDAEL